MDDDMIDLTRIFKEELLILLADMKKELELEGLIPTVDEVIIRIKSKDENRTTYSS